MMDTKLQRIGCSSVDVDQSPLQLGLQNVLGMWSSALVAMKLWHIRSDMHEACQPPSLS